MYVLFTSFFRSTKESLDRIRAADFDPPPFEAVEKGHFGLFRQKLHDGWSSIPCGKVTPSVMRGVIFEAHPPGDLLLPFQGNSPCVPENDRIKFYSTACGRRNSLQEGFFDKLKPRTA